MLTQSELNLLIKLGLVTPVAQTADGKVTEYRVTGDGRILAEKGRPLVPQYVKASIKGTGISCELNVDAIASVVKRDSYTVTVRTGLGLEYLIAHSNARTVERLRCGNCGHTTHETGSAECIVCPKAGAK